MVVPRGVAREKRRMNLKSRPNSILLLVMATLMDMDSANLWMRIDTNKLMNGPFSFISPNASPSKIECTLNAIINTNGVRLHLLRGCTAWCSDVRNRSTFSLSTNNSFWSPEVFKACDLD